MGKNEGLSSQLVERFDRFIDEVIDETCGTRIRRPPIPWPFPWVLAVVEDLTIVANSLQEGSMREELLRVTGRMMDRAAPEAGMG